MVSDRSRVTWVGPTAEHEMCNFYLMYWTGRLLRGWKFLPMGLKM